MSESNSEESTPAPARRDAFAARPNKTVPSKGKSSWLLWLVALGLGGLVLMVELPHELARWKYAAALEAREAGQKEKAYDLLKQAMERQPDKAEYQLHLARWKTEDRDFAGALEVVERLCESRPEQIGLLNLRGQLYMHLKRPAEAIDDLLTINRISLATGTPSRGVALNGLAYFRALAKVDLDEALQDANLAAKEAKAELDEAEATLKARAAEKKDVLGHSNEVANARFGLAMVLDTLGLIQLQREEFDQAQANFDRALTLARLAETFFRAQEGDSLPKSRQADSSISNRQERDTGVATMLYHRSQNLKKLGRDKEAERDFEEARKLIGREPDESLF